MAGVTCPCDVCAGVKKNMCIYMYRYVHKCEFVLHNIVACDCSHPSYTVNVKVAGRNVRRQIDTAHLFPLYRKVCL